jgi:hypothetical protein
MSKAGAEKRRRQIVVDRLRLMSGDFGRRRVRDEIGAHNLVVEHGIIQGEVAVT